MKNMKDQPVKEKKLRVQPVDNHEVVVLATLVREHVKRLLSKQNHDNNNLPVIRF